MLTNYFEEFGHKCTLKLNNPFDNLKRNKSRFQLWLMKNKIMSPKFILLRGRPRSCSALRIEMLYHLENHLYILHPFSPIVFYWDNLWMVIIYLWLFLLPFDIFRNMKYDCKWNHGPKYFQMAMSTVCLVDCARRFFTGYLIQHNDRDEIVLDFRRICFHYIKTYFLIDLLSSLPPFLGLEVPRSPKFYISLEFCMLLKLFRLCTLTQLTKIVMHYHKVNRNLNSIFRHILVLIFTVHWVTCFSIFLGVIDRRFKPNAYQWYDLFGQPSSIINTYVIFLHRSVSVLTGTGFHFFNEVMNVNDMVYLIFTAVFGRILTVIIFAVTYEKIYGMRSASAKYEDMINEIENYIKRGRLQASTANKIRTYYSYKYQHYYFKEKAILDEIPKSLQNNILLHCAKLLLHNIDFFKKLPDTVVANIVSHFENEIILAGDVISKPSDRDNSTYFLLSGTVATFTSPGREICHLEDGSHFGLSELLTEVDDPVAFKVALETCEISKLTSKHVYSLLDYCPSIFELIEEEVELRKQQILLIEERFIAFRDKYLSLQTLADERIDNEVAMLSTSNVNVVKKTQQIQKHF